MTDELSLASFNNAVSSGSGVVHTLPMKRQWLPLTGKKNGDDDRWLFDRTRCEPSRVNFHCNGKRCSLSVLGAG